MNNLVNTYISYCIVLHKNDYTVTVETFSGLRKQSEENLYQYRKTLDSNDITLEFATLRNFGKITIDLISVKLRQFKEQTKANN